jgi:hypothetical protein
MQSNQQFPAVQATRASARLHDTARAGFHYDKMKTMIAKYPGFCRACQQPIERGKSINFFGKGQAEHTNCQAGYAGSEDERAGFEPGTLANDRRLARNGLSVTRYASGHVSTTNSRGRCEDATCCGCCS